MQTHQSRKQTFYNSGQSLQPRQQDQEDSAFHSSQSYSNSQMMGSQQDNSQGSSFDLFSQMMSQQQGLSQNENAPSHRFYTKYMSKAPLFPRESQVDSRNPLPRRRSYQDLHEANKQKAKDRDDRDLINTFIALVKECADEVKSAADDIKNNVDRSMTESANKSVTIMKKINDDLSEHYTTLLDAMKEREAEKDKVAELEQALAAKEARIEVLESQLEIAKRAKDERVIQSVVDAYNEQQKVNRDHLAKLHEEQQKFTKEQVDIIQQHQDQMEKTYTVAFSEKQSEKSLDAAVPVQSNMPSNVVGTATQQSLLSNYDVLQSSTMLNSTTRMHPNVMASLMPVQSTQPFQRSMTQQIANCQSSSNGPPCNRSEGQVCNTSNSCSNWECQVPNCNKPTMPFQPNIPTSNINQSYHNPSTLFPNRQRLGNNGTVPQYQQQQSRTDIGGDVSHITQQTAPISNVPISRATSMPGNIPTSNAALYAMTSPLQDNPNASHWSRKNTNRLRPSPVATVAPQVVKSETCSPPNYSTDIHEIEEVQEQPRRSRRNQPEPRRYPARVQVKNQPVMTKKATNAKPKRQRGNAKPKKQNQQQQPQQQPLGSKRMYTQSPKQQKTNGKGKQNQQQQQSSDVYEFQDENRYNDASLLQAPAPKKMKKNTGASAPVQIQPSSSPQNDLYSRTTHRNSKSQQSVGNTGFGRSYLPKQAQAINTNKKAKQQREKQQHSWIFQEFENGEDEYDFNDESQSSAESPVQQVPRTNHAVRASNRHHFSSSIVPQAYSDDDDDYEEGSEESSQYPADFITMPKRKPAVSTQQTVSAFDILSTPCIQPQQYDSDDSPLVTEFRRIPGSAVRRRVSRQAERKRRLQSVMRRGNESDSAFEQITKTISRQRQKMKRSSSMLSVR